ncbi:MAG: cysteine desulfurase [Flavobacteriaceae bacterium]|nr:cysteine desulfurase [Flavobacteriaceae bacterium]
MKQVYLDNAATTPIHPEVIETMTRVMQEVYGNPSSTHQFGRKAKTVVEEARKYIAQQMNVSAGEVIFTSGGSEADNLILYNAVTNLGVSRIITSRIEHHAVLHTIEALADRYGVKVDYVALDARGSVDYDHLEQLLVEDSPKTLVSLMHINNELGILLDLQKVTSLCEKYHAYFHSDTVQTIGHYELDLQKTPVDFITCSAHKFHGPKGVGFAIVKKGIPLKPILIGGEQERGHRAGTENVHNIAGLHKALEIAYGNLEADRAYISDLKAYFIKGLSSIVPGIGFNGLSDDPAASSYIILNVLFPKSLSMFLFNLDLKGVAASGGSACQSGSDKGSHVLHAILPDAEAKKTSVRFSFSKFLGKEDLDYALDVIKSLS